MCIKNKCNTDTYLVISTTKSSCLNPVDGKSYSDQTLTCDLLHSKERRKQTKTKQCFGYMCVSVSSCSCFFYQFIHLAVAVGLKQSMLHKLTDLINPPNLSSYIIIIIIIIIIIYLNKFEVFVYLSMLFLAFSVCICCSVALPSTLFLVLSLLSTLALALSLLSTLSFGISL